MTARTIVHAGPPAVIGIREAAELLGVSIPTLRRWDRAGKLPATRHPLTGERVYRADVLAALAGSSGATRPPALSSSRAAIPSTTTLGSPTPPSIVGRGAELRRLLTKLADGARLITVVGPGGIGKTTLIERALVDLRETNLRTAFCDLSNASAARVVPVVAAALGLELSGALHNEGHVRLVADRLARSGALVLAIDNAEHVATEVAALVRAWRVRAPHTSFVVTSRQKLRLRDEVVIDLGPLPTADAVTLLLHAAERTGARVDPRRHADVLVRIVRRLDAIPLAIELAAPRLATYAAPDLLQMLDKQLDLASRRRDTPARHTTLRAAIAWSYDLLAPAERDLFERLSVFRGGFDAMAAAAIIADSVNGVALLEALREQSIVHAVVGDGEGGDHDRPRFDLYESLRAFAAERLATRPAIEKDAYGRHAAHIRTLARAALDAPLTDVPVTALARERENILAVLARPSEVSGEDALLFAIAADYAVGASMTITARENLLDHAIKSSRRADRVFVARAHTLRGRLRVERNDMGGGARDLERALVLAKAARAPLIEEYVVGLLAIARLRFGPRGAVSRALTRAEKVARGVDRPGRSLTWTHIATVHHELGDLASAERGFARAIVLARAEGQEVLAARIRARMGRTYIDSGKLEDAEDALAQARAALVSDRFEAWAHAHTALLRWHEGRLDDAREAFATAVRLFTQRGAASFETVARTMLASVLAALGRSVDAADEIARARVDAIPLADPGLDALIVLAEAHRALLAARRTGEAATPIVQRAYAKTRRVAERDKDVRALAERLTVMSQHTELPTRPALVVAASGAWMTPPPSSPREQMRQERVTLPPSSPLRAIMRLLVTTRTRAATGGVSRDALVDAAWPKERILPRAAAHRLHAAVSELRALGLGDLLERTPEGYALSSTVPVRIEEG